MPVSFWFVFPVFLFSSGVFFGMYDIFFGNNSNEPVVLETVREDETFFIDVAMCQVDDCEAFFISYFKEATDSIRCAFFDFKLEGMREILVSLQNNLLVEVISDRGHRHFTDSFMIYDNRSSFMHHKFCVIDEVLVLTGSFNPTPNGRDRNDNNVIAIYSKEIASSYVLFYEMLKYEIHNGLVARRNIFSDVSYRHFFRLEETDISLCFSRGGDCRDFITSYLAGAHNSIHFMTFAFTDRVISSMILMRFYEGLPVNGIYDRRQMSQYATYHHLSFHNVSVFHGCGPGMMHHKVFVVDEEIVITGSFNPSRNADERNDENVIIIRNAELAETFLKEFERITNLCMMSLE